jgi:flagellin
MIINPLTGIVTGAAGHSTTKSAQRVQSALASLAAGSRLVQASDDVSALSIATQMQNALSGYRQAATNVAQAQSLVETADQGAQNLAQIVERMTQLATQANAGALDDTARAGINTEFQALSQELTRLSSTTRFNGSNLLDGTLSGGGALSLRSVLGPETGEDVEALSIADLSAPALFGGAAPDLLTQENAAAALEALEGASGAISGALADIGSFAATLDYAAAGLDTIMFNIAAASSDLTDADLASASTETALAHLQRNFGLAILAQGERLSPSMLKLVE